MRKLISLIAWSWLAVLLTSISATAQWLPNYSSQSADAVTETVGWSSAVPATTQVRWGTTSSTSHQTSANSTLLSIHSVTLPNLLDGTLYYWRAVSKDNLGIQVTGSLATFTTPQITVTVAPATATLTFGKTQMFNVTVSGVSNQSVTWAATAGTITSAGLFTAPSISGTVNVTATSKVGAHRMGTAVVTVNSGTTTTHSVTLNWQASTTTGVLYRAYRGAAAGGPYGLIADNLPSLTYADLAVTAGQTYFYVVTAFDADGESANSNEVAAVIPSP